MITDAKIARRDSWIDRLKMEWRDLAVKIIDLEYFIYYEPTFTSLTEYEQKMLIDQRDCMAEYKSALGMRLKHHNREGDEN